MTFRRLLRILRRTPHQLEAVPCSFPALAGERRWRSALDAGLFELRTRGDALPGGWVELDLEIGGTLPAAPQVWVDDGSGFAEAGGLKLPLPRAGRVHAVVELPPQVHRLLLEVGNASRVTLGQLVARELGPVQAAALLAAPVIKRRLAEPWTIPIAAVRLVRMLLTSGTLRRLWQKEISEEPQLWYELWHQRFAELSEDDRDAIRAAAARMEKPPRFSVLLVACGGGERELARAVASVRRQLYPNWELLIASAVPNLRSAAEKIAQDEPRVALAPWNGEGGPAGAASSALRSAAGEFVLFLDPAGELTQHALYLLAEEARAHPDADMIYADEDSADAHGRLHDPIFKPDWNTDLFYSIDYLGRACAVRTTSAVEAGGVGDDFDGSCGQDLLLRIFERSSKIHHVPFVIHHRHAGGTLPASEAGIRALQRYLGAAAQVEAGPFPATHRVRWRLPAEQRLVSLIIPTRDARHLLEPCVESLLSRTAYRNFEVLVVDNQSRDPGALEYLAALEKRGAARVLRYDKPFNYPAINNFAAAQARGEILGLLNNDLEFIEPGWLEEMVSHALRPEIGAVGARLLYPDRTVQHAGVVLGIGGIADHVHKDLPEDAPGYCGRARLAQDFSAVTAACLLVRRKVYLEAGGLDEEFAVAFNDVDFCLRLRERGLRNLWTPFATVIHHESKSRGRDNTPARMLRFRGEMERLRARWGKLLLNDPAYSPNLTLDAKNFSLAWPPRVRPPWR